MYRCFITGVSGGIGRYLFDNLKALDMECYGTYNSRPLDEVNVSKVDISDYASVENWVNSILENSDDKKLIVLNCAGLPFSQFTHKSDPNAWKEVVNVNLIGSYNVIRATLCQMRNLNFGRIINFSSVVAQTGTPGTSAYASAKSGLWGLTKTIAKENGTKGITANCLNLGYFNTGMINNVSEHVLAQTKYGIPSKRLGEPHEVLSTVKLLIDNSYINGTSIDINGGFH